MGLRTLSSYSRSRVLAPRRGTVAAATFPSKAEVRSHPATARLQHAFARIADGFVPAYSHACPSLSRSLAVFRLYVRISASSHESRYVPPLRFTPLFQPADRIDAQLEYARTGG